MSLRAKVTLLVAAAVTIALAVGSIGARFSTEKVLRDAVDDSLRDRTNELARGRIFAEPPRAARALPPALAAVLPDFVLGSIPTDEQRQAIIDAGFPVPPPGVPFPPPFPPRAGAVSAALGIPAPPVPEVPALDQGADVLEADSSDPFVEQIVASGLIVPLGDGVTALPLADIDPLNASTDITFSNFEINGEGYRMAARLRADGAVVQVARSTAEIDQSLANIDGRLLQMALVTVALTSFAGWYMVRRTMAPIEQLSEAVNRVAETRNFRTPIEVSSQDEVGRLAQDFNTMLEAVQSAQEQQHRLVVDAGHELRTPLTSLGTSLELLGRGGIDEEDEEVLRSRVVREFLSLSAMAEALVQLGSDPVRSEAAEQCDLVNIVRGAVDVARRRHPGPIEVESVDAAPIVGQPVMLERAVANLLENATKYGPPSGTITVGVGPRRVEVCDQGPGIAPADLGRVFDRFFRSTDAMDVDGSGLGLSIVKYAAEAQGGHVFASNLPSGGACVGFQL